MESAKAVEQRHESVRTQVKSRDPALKVFFSVPRRGCRSKWLKCFVKQPVNKVICFM